MPLYQTILVPTDFSRYADNATRYAQALAKASGGTVHFAHVIDQRVLDWSSISGPYASAGNVGLSLASIEEHAKKRMKQLMTRAQALGLKAESHLATGHPADELAKIATETQADLIVIATHGHSGFDRLVLGSTCERLLRHATVPVLAVKKPGDEISDDDETLHIGRILCPCDFSEFSKAAVPYAAELSRQFGATLVLAHVVDTWLDYPEFMPSVEIENSPHLAERAQESLEQIAKGLTNVRTEIQVKSGVPHRVIAQMAESDRVDLIVMATHGRSGIPHFLLGSVTEKVVRLAPCPVLTIRLDSGK